MNQKKSNLIEEEQELSESNSHQSWMEGGDIQDVNSDESFTSGLESSKSNLGLLKTEQEENEFNNFLLSSSNADHDSDSSQETQK